MAELPPDAGVAPSEGSPERDSVGHPHAPPWVTFAGAFFGLITLLGLFGLVYLSATNPELVCNSYPLLVAIFSLGCALSAGFIGGRAAANGQLGTAVEGYSLAFAVGGGIAVLVLAFGAFTWLIPIRDVCRAPQVISETFSFTDFDGTPQLTSGSVWKQTGSIQFRSFVRIRLERASGRTKRTTARLDFDVNGLKCHPIGIHILDDLEPLSQAMPGDMIGPIPRQSLQDDIELIYNSRCTEGECATCFTHNREEVHGVALVVDASDVYFLKVPAGELKVRYDGEFSRVRRAANAGPVGHSSLLTLLAGVAFAQEHLPFAELQKFLLSSDSNVRIESRKYLSDKFSEYETEVIKEIFEEEQSDSGYLANLISAMIAGIDQQTEGSLAPNQSRDLSISPPYIGGREADIVWLTGHPAAAVRQQARRLIQRYPVDGFLQVYEPLLERGAHGDCRLPADTASKTESSVGDVDTKDAVFYSSVFFYYNRIVQFNYQPTLSAADIDTIEAYARNVKTAAANCINSPSLMADVSLVDFGRALVYYEDLGADPALRDQRSRAAADSFFAWFDSNPSVSIDNYYMAAHVRQMESFASR